jgi:hypothetical protein
MILKNLLKKLKQNKGITGTDIAAAISVIVVTMGVVTAIYINVVNKVKENIRYSNATRIATQIVENIQAKTYDYFVNIFSEAELNGNVYTKNVSGGSGVKLIEVNIPSGYSATIKSTMLNGTNELDVIREIEVNVSYKISNQNKTISLSTTKEKELLEQTNKPDISRISLASNQYCYPIKSYNSGYVITDVNDSDWYNYDSTNGKKYALVFVTTGSGTSYDIGKTITKSNGTIYAWIPRFGKNSSNKITYCYGTSSYLIGFVSWTSNSKTLYTYSLSYSSTTNLKNGIPTTVSGYFSNTFTSTDGLTGVWYNLSSTSSNTTTITNIKNVFVNTSYGGFALPSI